MGPSEVMWWKCCCCCCCCRWWGKGFPHVQTPAPGLEWCARWLRRSTGCMYLKKYIYDYHMNRWMVIAKFPILEAILLKCVIPIPFSWHQSCSIEAGEVVSKSGKQILALPTSFQKKKTHPSSPYLHHIFTIFGYIWGAFLSHIWGYPSHHPVVMTLVNNVGMSGIHGIHGWGPNHGVCTHLGRAALWDWVSWC